MSLNHVGWCLAPRGGEVVFIPLDAPHDGATPVWAELPDSDGVRRLDVQEFREFGYLQESNRLFFHPLGLALEVSVDSDHSSFVLSGVIDARDDPEGFLFAEGVLGHAVAHDKADRVAAQSETMASTRVHEVGWVVQQLEPVAAD